MDQISEHINYSNNKIHSYDQMRKVIVSLDSKNYKNNNNPTWKLNHIHNSLLMSIVDNPQKDLSNVYRKPDMRKVPTSSINLSSTLFYF